MRTQLSEKNFFAAIIVFVAGLLLLIKTEIIIAPVRISETGILWSLVAMFLIVLGLRLFRRSIVKA